MKKSLAMICSVASLVLLNVNGVSVIAKDKEKKEEKKKEEKKQEEIKLEGKVEKKEKDFFLKTKTEEIKLPVSKEKDSKIKLEDFVDKEVTVTGMGFDNKTKKGAETIEKHVIESISDIKIVEAKKEEKKEEKK